MEKIMPSSDLRNRYSEISNACKETREPIYITVNGRGDTVIMNINEYEKMKTELELLKMLATSENDMRNGNIKPASESIKELREKIKKWNI